VPLPRDRRVAGLPHHFGRSIRTKVAGTRIPNGNALTKYDREWRRGDPVNRFRLGNSGHCVREDNLLRALYLWYGLRGG
jgi:hypothetical protein